MLVSNRVHDDTMTSNIRKFGTWDYHEWNHKGCMHQNIWTQMYQDQGSGSTRAKQSTECISIPFEILKKVGNCWRLVRNGKTWNQYSELNHSTWSIDDDFETVCSLRFDVGQRWAILFTGPQCKRGPGQGNQTFVDNSHGLHVDAVCVDRSVRLQRINNDTAFQWEQNILINKWTINRIRCYKQNQML